MSMTLRSKIVLLVTIGMLACSGLLAAKHSEGFPLGTYSYIANIFPYHAQYRKELCKYMQELGYNVAMVQTDTKDTDLKGLLTDLDDRGLDAILLDRSWSVDSRDPMHYGLQALTMSNYCRLEAEYDGGKDVNKGDSQDSSIWYASTSDKRITRIGSPRKSPEASNGFVWFLKKGANPGYAYADLSLRWPKKDGTLYRAGQIWQVFQGDSSKKNEQYVYIRYRFKLSKVESELDDSEVLLRFEPVGFPLSGGGYAATPNRIKSKDEKGLKPEDNPVFTYKDYKGSKDGFLTYTVRLSYADLLESGMMAVESSKLYKIINLNPRLWWSGKCDLFLDYIEIEDQMHFDLRTSPEQYTAGIRSRLEQMLEASKGNIAAFYTFDEPLQPQLHSMKLVQDYLAGSGIETFTATHDYNYRLLQTDKKNDKYYEHLENFTNTATPNIVAPDIYPLTPDIEWNSPSSSSPGKFIQDMYDKKLHAAYYHSKKYRDERAGRKFFPIVQNFGKWGESNKTQQWMYWMLAPKATQKAMNLFPLCYGPDGILHYRLQSFRDEKGLGEYAPISVLSVNGKYAPPSEDRSSYDAVLETNPQVSVYGSFLKQREWKGVRTLMTERFKLNKTYSGNLLDDVRVMPSEGEYSGYVQAGFYQDDFGSPIIMLVNRRANYFSPGEISTPKLVPYEKYKTYFPEAEPQTVSFGVNKKSRSARDMSLALFDRFDAKVYIPDGNSINVRMNAGEGKLLQLVALDRLSGKISQDSWLPVVITKDMLIDRSGKFTIAENDNITLLPGATLTVETDTQLILKGKITALPGARIIVKGNFDFAPDRLSLAGKDQMSFESVLQKSKNAE